MTYVRYRSVSQVLIKEGRDMFLKILLAVSLVVVFLADFAICQEERVVLEDNEHINENIKWLWGEVVSVNQASGELKVKYVDYEKDKENEIVIVATKQTELENAASLKEILAGDYASIDYEIKNGKNEAAFIIIETIEGESEEIQPINL